MLYNSILDLVGNTPLLELKKIEEKFNLKGKLFAKLEYLNPAGSIKDRTALKMIEDFEKDGLIKQGDTIIEPTSGNTGIGLAMVCKAKGYKLILTMPETMSIERRKLISAYGAEIVLTDASLGMQGSVDKAEELNKQIKGSVIAGQFYNPSNIMAHYETTGPEIFKDLNGKIDGFVASVGTGGTLSGTSKFLKENIKDIKVFAVEPMSSPLISKGIAGAHKIQGIGANFIPKNLDKSVIDEVLTVSNEDAFKYGKILASSEAILCGISSGATLKCAIDVCLRDEFKNKNVVVILPDSGDRYLSTELY